MKNLDGEFFGEIFIRKDRKGKHKIARMLQKLRLVKCGIGKLKYLRGEGSSRAFFSLFDKKLVREIHKQTHSLKCLSLFLKVKQNPLC